MPMWSQYHIHQCLILLLTGYVTVSVIYDHTLILSHYQSVWSAKLLEHTKCFIPTWSTQMLKSDHDITLALMSTYDYRPALQAHVSAAYTVYHCQLLCSVSMNPVNNWIQSNATSKFRVEPTSWPRRHTVSVARAVSWYRLITVTVRVNWNKTSILKSLHGTRNHDYLSRCDAAYSRSSLPRLSASWQHQPRPLSMCTQIEHLRHFGCYYGLNYNYGTIGLLRWLCDIRIDDIKWLFAVDIIVCKQTGTHRI